MTIKTNEFYVADDHSLAKLLQLIEERKIIAIDTEFTRQTTYYPILSIIQIAVKNSQNQQEIFIIDCLAKLDLAPIFAIIADEKIVKILHSSAQDLQIFYQASKAVPANIFDTQLMANFCGLGFSVGYSQLVKIFFDKELNKQQQRSNWQARPLSQKQLEYAFLDVLYLEEIYEKFLASLTSNGRLSWYREEIESFVSKALFPKSENLLRNFVFRNRSAKQIEMIKNLVLWREDEARRINVPRQFVIKDELLEKIAVEQILPENLSNKLLVQIKEILDCKTAVNCLSEGLAEEKKSFFMSEAQKILNIKANDLLLEISAQNDFKKQFLLTSDDLKKIICQPNLFDKIVFGWRHSLFGNQLKNLITS